MAIQPGSLVVERYVVSVQTSEPVYLSLRSSEEPCRHGWLVFGGMQTLTALLVIRNCNSNYPFKSIVANEYVAPLQ